MGGVKEYVMGKVRKHCDYIRNRPKEASIKEQHFTFLHPTLVIANFSVHRHITESPTKVASYYQ